MIRFETKPPTSASAEPSVIWGPWRKPVCVVSLQAVLVEVALPGTRVPRIQILNVSTANQMFFASGTDIVSTAGDNIRLISAFHGAGESCLFAHDTTELDFGYWQIPLPQWLILPPSYRLQLSIDGDQTGDVLSDLVLGLDDVLEFRQ